MTPYVKLLGGALASDDYLRNPVIEELVDAIFGEGNWHRHWSVTEAAFPGSSHMVWHSDQTPDETPDPDAPHTPLRVAFNIPLVDFTWANGATEFLPGSHLLPYRFAMDDTLVELPNVYPVSLFTRRGDAFLRDGNCLHRGTPNQTKAPRVMLDQTYRVGPGKLHGYRQ